MNKDNIFIFLLNVFNTLYDFMSCYFEKFMGINIATRIIGFVLIGAMMLLLVTSVITYTLVGVYRLGIFLKDRTPVVDALRSVLSAIGFIASLILYIPTLVLNIPLMLVYKVVTKIENAVIYTPVKLVVTYYAVFDGVILLFFRKWFAAGSVMLDIGKYLVLLPSLVLVAILVVIFVVLKIIQAVTDFAIVDELFALLFDVFSWSFEFITHIHYNVRDCILHASDRIADRFAFTRHLRHMFSNAMNQNVIH